jgi:hypothetical protein
LLILWSCDDATRVARGSKAALRVACAADPEEQSRLCIELQKQLWQDARFIPMGEYCQATAYGKELKDVLPGCFAVFLWPSRTVPPDSLSKTEVFERSRPNR